MSVHITEDLRKKIYDDLADLMIVALERQELDVPEMKKSASFILGTLDTITDEDQLIDFLKTLGEKWRAYGVELTRYQGEKTQQVDKQKIEEIQGRLSQFIQTQKT
ncbi:MAG: hypothetical protein V1922_05850 [bacterium]